jgi:type VI secretion system secreted protein Hcp
MATTPNANPSATNYYLNLPGIPGEATSPKCPEQIVINRFDFQVQNECKPPSPFSPTLWVSGSWMPAVRIGLQTSAASPKLFLACAEGTHFGEAFLTGFKAGASEPYLKITLSDVLVSEYATSSIPGEGPEDSFIPREEIALTFGKVELEYQQQEKTGPVGKPVRFAYSQVTNANV